MSLTWRDVAGGVRAPDLGEATDAITRGILGLGDAVKQVLGAPEARRQADLANQLQIATVGQKFADTNQARSEHTADRQRVLDRDAAETAFGAVQSDLMGLALEAGQKGRPLTDVTQSEIFRNLDPRAQGLAQGVLANSYAAGQDDRRQQLNADRNFALQQQQERRMAASAAQQARVQALQIKALEKAQQDARDLDPYRYGAALGDFTQRVSAKLYDASGGAYADKSLADLAKGAGLSDISEATESLNALNAYRVGMGKEALPEGVLKSLIAGQAGKNGWVTGLFNGFDQGDFETALGIRADLYDSAQMEHMLLKDLRGRAKGGEVFTNELVSKELARLNPPKPVKIAPASSAGQIQLADVYSIGRK